MGRYYLGIDQGTTGTTVLLFDENWKPCARGYQELTQHYPRPGWVEQDPVEIWRSVRDVVPKVIADSGLQAGRDEIACLGLANQGETVVAWDRETGVPVCPAIVWQDRRIDKESESIAWRYGDLIRTRTGLFPDAYFSAGKISWILEHVEGAKKKLHAGRLCAGTLDAWLIWNMTEGRVFMTDPSTASRTLLYDPQKGDWDEDILGIMNIPREILPEIRPGAGAFGETAEGIFPGMRIPISGSLTDQQAALFGQACTMPGMIKTTYGTGCFMLMNTGTKPVFSGKGLLTTVAWGLDAKERIYALEGGVHNAGSAVQWLRDGLRIIADAKETGPMAESIPDTGGVYFVPAFSGLAAPWQDPGARGTIVGLTAGTTREQLVRATLESQAYQIGDIFRTMEQETGLHIPVMRTDGGGSNNDFLMQFQADILGIPVEVPEINETTAYGAASLAAYGAGYMASTCELAERWQCRKRYEPQMLPEKREELLHSWHRAIERSRGWIEEE